jgi:hypothetical protein
MQSCAVDEGQLTQINNDQQGARQRIPERSLELRCGIEV